MDSFKVYLPSNACPNLFPDNTPTDYRIRFDKPIDLDGKWEVGAESVFYSSRINDEKERTQIRLNVETRENRLMNSLYPYEFNIPDSGIYAGLWNGYRGISPKNFEKEGSKIQSVLDTLNNMNYDMLTEKTIRETGKLFRFYLNDNGVVLYESKDRSFVLQITNHMAHILGFSYATVFYGTHLTAISVPQQPKRTLEKGDYLLRYMHLICQETSQRLYLKPFGVAFDGKKETVLALWKQAVTSVVKISAEFSSSNKLILHNHVSTIGMRFSPHFAERFYQLAPFFGRGSRWAGNAANLNTEKTEEEHWYITLYTEHLATIRKSVFSDFSLDFYPWRYNSMKQILHLINSQIETFLRKELTVHFYDAEKHRFLLTLDDTTEHCKLTLGPWLSSCNLSKNLSYLLGFKHEEIREQESFGTRKVDSLSNHSRQLHVLSNVMQPTSYGKHQRQILCDFLHTQNVRPITGKRFNPISYHPVARNGIDMIRIQLTDDLYNNISIQDAATIVTLYFRKVK